MRAFAFALASVLVAGAASLAAQAPSADALPLGRLAALRERLGGGAVLRAAAREALVTGATLRRTLPLQRGRCVRIVAAAGPGLTDLDLRLEDPEGRPVQEDLGDGDTASLGVREPLCPERTGSYELLLIASEGSGSLAWQLLGPPRAEAAQAGAPAHVVGGPPGYLGDGLRDAHARAGEGRPAITAVHRAELARSETTTLRLATRRGRCYLAIAAGAPSIRALSLRVRDAFGQPRGNAGPAQQPAARFCAATDGPVEVILKAERGYGPVALQVFGPR